jgi:hypothetical protein
MAKTKFTPRVQRGTPEFERDYLLHMGYVRECVGRASEHLPPGVRLETAARTHAACDWLYDIALECDGVRHSANIAPGPCWACTETLDRYPGTPWSWSSPCVTSSSPRGWPAVAPQGLAEVSASNSADSRDQ